MKNKEIAEQIFDYMNSIGFIPYNIEYGNTYFLFMGAPDSIVWFRVKGVSKHWKFGMWIYEEIYDAPDKQNEVLIQFFCQWDTQIDKFKPSRSDVLSELTVERFKNQGSWRFYEIECLLKMLKRHPLLCYCGYCGKSPGFTSQRFLWKFIINESYEIRRAIRRYAMTAVFYPLCRWKVFRVSRKKYIDFCEIYHYEKRHPGYVTSHIYKIECRFKAEANEEDMQKVDQIFKRKEYGSLGEGDYVAGLVRYTQIGFEGGFLLSKQQGEKRK